MSSSAHARDRYRAEERVSCTWPRSPTVWTLEEVHSLPDDGNKYELVRGELFVTPPPTFGHETIGARLTRLLDPFIAVHHLALVYHPKAVMRFEGPEVEPDLMVRQAGGRDTNWDNAPVPILVVESIRAGEPDRLSADHITWSPPGPEASLAIEVAEAFGPVST